MGERGRQGGETLEGRGWGHFCLVVGDSYFVSPCGLRLDTLGLPHNVWDAIPPAGWGMARGLEHFSHCRLKVSSAYFRWHHLEFPVGPFLFHLTG